ncbi:hypothetical protein PGRAN_09576 [Listeria grandensis FSL F6-0971]|uniref:AlgX/AlgJ SGNH hydrolase-like domain-containing protein n=1 Tax=Listeria grandensis FSL F6-0971 TaxID=1265819 RepID=W7BEC5_9LIST|nr:DHHW family protein [Listeria grandensis]EUJ23170.1 hypothetical protein PGRAN_09576 [Listeria grandensis FSL F6-0971]
MNKKLFNILLSAGFLLLIFGVFFFYLFAGKNQVSILESRNLAQKPDFSADAVSTGDYMKKWDVFFNDQFPRRDAFTELNMRVNQLALGQDVYKDVYVAPDGYLLTKVEQYTKADAKKIADRVNNVGQSLQKMDVKTSLVLVPNKSTVFEAKFPTYYPSFGREGYERLMPMINEKYVQNIDISQILYKNKNKANMFFYTDHHWQATAAFLASEKVTKEMNPGVKQLTMADWTWKLEGLPFYGSDARKTTSALVSKSDQVMVAEQKHLSAPYKLDVIKEQRDSLYVKSRLTDPAVYANRYTTYIGTDYPEAHIQTPNPLTNKNLLIFKDSYANAFIQFIAPYYANVHVLDLRYYKNLDLQAYVKKYDIDQALLFFNNNSIYATPQLTTFE